MKLTDAFQNYLQGEINTCVAGHDARIERLVSALDEISQLVEDQRAFHKVLSDHVYRADAKIESLNSTNAQLEGTLRVMQKQIDKLEKTSTDQFDEYLRDAFDRHMRKYAKYHGLEDLMDPDELWDLVREYVAGEIVEQLGNIKLTVSTS